ncbi:MAG: hypothetical protein LBN43_03400 [Oscillospiraceae bacterium]|jgi:hypothetical protein|nr:hypothetical protein [Oscillospiraceae bacterium]
MKKKLVSVMSVLALAIPFFAITAFAAPSTEVTFGVSEAIADGNDIIVTVDIAVTSPTEPYASLDFNLVSSDYEHLAILDLDDDEEVTELDIAFAPDYGQAYHSGRFDDETSGYRYLIGIYSQSSGNQITEATEVCSVRLRYSGDITQTLLIRDMKLVYIDDVGGVASAPINSDSAILTIDSNVLRELTNDPIPLGSEPVSNELASTSGIPFAVWIAVGVLVVLASTTVVFVFRKKKNA